MSRTLNELNPSSFSKSSMGKPVCNKPSFKGYQNHHVPSSARGISNKRGSSLAMGLLLVLVPSLLVGGVLAYQSYNQQQQNSASQTAYLALSESELQSDLEPKITEPGITSVSAVSMDAGDEVLFSVRSAPISQPLKSLPRQEVYAQIGSSDANTAGGTTVIAANSESSLAQPQVQQSASDEANNLQSSSDLQSNKDLQSDSDLLQGLDLSELPPDLALKLESMMGEQQGSPEPMDSRPVGNMDSQTIGLETHGNRLSGVLPKLDLQTHMYSSSETKRWVKVNGHEVAQGEWIDQDIQLLEIKPQSVIIEFNQQKIEIPALYEWKG